MEKDKASSPSSSCNPGPSTSTSEDPKTLSEVLSAPENQGAVMVVPLGWCPHLESSREGARRLARGEEKAALNQEAPCADCGAKGENWVRIHISEARANTVL